MHFVAMAIQLQHKDRSAPLTTADGPYAHAAVLHAISDQDASLGRILHDAGRHKRMTLAIVRSDRWMAALRLAFMAQEGLLYANAIVNALSVRPVLQLAQTTCTVEGVDLVNPPWASISTWADLQSHEVGRYMRFAFITPTAIMKQNSRGRRFSALFPESLDVFSGLEKRWRALQGPALPKDLAEFVRAGGCVASDFDLRAVKFTTRERTQVGFLGWVVYECRTGELAYIAALNALTRLAFFTGVGYQTARGMGAVKTAISN